MRRQTAVVTFSIVQTATSTSSRSPAKYAGAVWVGGAEKEREYETSDVAVISPERRNAAGENTVRYKRKLHELDEVSLASKLLGQVLGLLHYNTLREEITVDTERNAGPVKNMKYLPCREE